MSGISLKNVGVSLGGVAALDGISLDVADGEFAALVGPSGCGKSVALRVIAGLDKPKSGEVIKDGSIINDVEPRERDMAMVFERYALYPNKTVYDNLAYGLKLRKTDKAEIDRRVLRAAELVGISRILNKKPKALSPMDVKRAELARVVVRSPSVFLLDEPLGSLSGKDRIDALMLIRRLWRATGITFIYATRCFEDAAALGARIAVMNGGAVLQAGTKDELFGAPKSLAVARICSPLLNVFDATVTTENDKSFASFGNNKIEISAPISERMYLAIRPEDIAIAKKPNGRCVTATVDVVERLGAESVLYMYANGKPEYIVARVAGGDYDHGDNLLLYFAEDKLMLFDAETEKAINVQAH